MERDIIQAEQWRQVILKFSSKFQYKNPFKDVIIKAEFKGPLGRVIKREAYWDGEDIYKVSFAPTEVGMWTWVIEAPIETGLNELSGEINCKEYTGDLDIYKNGFLKVSKSDKYLEYNNGTPFFWLGDTNWEFAYKEMWDKSNHPEMKSMFKGMVERRVNQGYNVYQTNLRSDKVMGGEKLYWIVNKGDYLPNVDFYKNELDRRMYYIADAGLVNALGIAWFIAMDDGVEKQKDLARYIIARYGSLPIIWTLAGEVAGYGNEESRVRNINSWREVAKYIEMLDGYDNLQTAHYTNERPFPDYYHNESWFDFTLNQAGHGDYPISTFHYREFLKNNNDKPFIEGEAFYEFCSTLEENGIRLCTSDMLRRVAYMSIQLGGCGYTYGAQGIWDNVLEKGKENPMKLFNRFDITWYEAIDGEGRAQMGYMKAFYEKMSFWEMKPYSGDSDDSNLFAKKAPLITINEEKDRVVIYYPDMVENGYGINGIKNGKYFYTWFNPRNGEYQVDGNIINVTEGKIKLPNKPAMGDWLLIIKGKDI